MTGEELINLIGLDRAKSGNSKGEKLLESEAIVFDQVRKFGVNSIYFNTDENGNSFPAIFLKKIKVFDVETLQVIADTHRKIWNYKKVLFLYVYSETEIRIYNCSEKPLIKAKVDFDYEKELQNVEIKAYQFSDKKQFEELNKLFSRIAVDSGIIWTLEEARFIRDKINLQKRVDKYLVDSLVNTANQLEQQGLEINFIHKIILRSLFLLYLEDRGATDKKLYGQIKKGAQSYFDILDDVKATYQLYERLEDDFNGNVFTLEKDEKISVEQLQLIQKCFISGNDDTPQTKLFENWRLFDFSIIQIELLSEIYENFLFKTDPELKKKTGTYYTPPALVEFILNEKLPINKTDKNYNIKVLDPSCGSGIFLVESFKRLVKRYENQHKEKPDFDTLVKLLKENIFGIETNPQAIKVAAFSLYLALVDKLDPKNLWQKKKHRLPNLINNPNDKLLKASGNNLFCRDTIADLSEDTELKDFKLIVGNPPFGKILSEENDKQSEHKNLREYCEREKLAKEMVLPFLHKATKFGPNGEIALIFNTKVLTNTGGTYRSFRKWLFNDCYVEKVFNFSILRNANENFGGQLFGDATGPISIVFYQREQPEKASDKIAYYAPKTYIKTNVIDGLSIDFTDLKYLPREECQKPDTKIWKIAMWGGMNDWELINRVSEKFNTSIGEFLENNKEEYHFGSGLHSPTEKQLKENKTFSPSKVINLRKVQRFYTLKSAEAPSQKVYRSINQNIFKPPYLIIKEGLKNKEFCASWIDYKSYHTGAFSISSIDQHNNFILKLLCSLINSSFAKYYLSLTSASWGIERERVQSNETLTLPMPIDINKKVILKLELKFDELIKLIQDDFDFVKTKPVESEINKIILQDLFLFSDSDKWAIDDLTNYSIDLFENKEKSIALYSVLPEQITEYGKTMSVELTEFLDGQDLFANATVYSINRFTPLMMIKLSHENIKKDVFISKENVDKELKQLDKCLWEKKATNIYFRKKLNYKKGDDIYIIRPNQRRFWSKSMALEDASELILEILNGIHDETK
ncbi:MULTISPECIES: class I SAM-dependent DNA methyltransferase [unclassified Kaistella]|uniref:HsdM family class I SAM-dependent methyltransferase n=1 Tax=unclassified Kaistella TaxID=2762626 RepID=UPI002736BFBB|nr:MULTISPECIES: N-6 DNA methylase [unclassified Kaistella]MDP2452493.1 N-6 DNA methylase [Kaistella sp. SH11-4b]MDP2455401.1 N-6 DNA methylase [Kaistella sp. SH40-3]MDP2458305.1 N-6 DNA methylase [Kaistella sp. SH19-2b]